MTVLPSCTIGYTTFIRWTALQSLEVQEQLEGGLARGVPVILEIRRKGALLNDIGGGALPKTCHLVPPSASEFRVACQARLAIGSQVSGRETIEIGGLPMAESRH